jgi:hypothetical protein
MAVAAVALLAVAGSGCSSSKPKTGATSPPLTRYTASELCKLLTRPAERLVTSHSATVAEIVRRPDFGGAAGSLRAAWLHLPPNMRAAVCTIRVDHSRNAVRAITIAGEQLTLNAAHVNRRI